MLFTEIITIFCENPTSDTNCDVYATNKTGYSSDDWIDWQFGYTLTLNYIQIRVFCSHVKSSQADHLYSSVLLLFTRNDICYLNAPRNG
jgi:hypothetical protein